VNSSNALQQHNKGIEVLDSDVFFTFSEARDQNGCCGLQEIAQQLSAGEDNRGKHSGRRATNLPAHIIVVTVITITLPEDRR
jgi:hypothetical protein